MIREDSVLIAPYAEVLVLVPIRSLNKDGFSKRWVFDEEMQCHEYVCLVNNVYTCDQH